MIADDCDAHALAVTFRGKSPRGGFPSLVSMSRFNQHLPACDNREIIMVPRTPPRRPKSDKEPLTIEHETTQAAASEAESVAAQEAMTDDSSEIRADETEQSPTIPETEMTEDPDAGATEFEARIEENARAEEENRAEAA